MKISMLVSGVVALVFATLWFFLLSFQFLRLDATYSYSAINEGVTRITFPDGRTEEVSEFISRDDSVVDIGDGVAVISNVFQGTSGDGEIIFEGSSRYTVDLITRENVVVDDGEVHEGYFMFPPFVEKRDYWFSSPEVLEAPGFMSFQREEKVNGLNTYVFTYDLQGLEKTQFFSTSLIGDLSVIGSHIGQVMVEPVSGRIVHFQHSGVNVLVDETGAYVRDFQEWNNEFTSEVREAQEGIARSLKLRYLLIRHLVAGLALIFGVFMVVMAFVRKGDYAARQK